MRMRMRQEGREVSKGLQPGFPVCIGSARYGPGMTTTDASDSPRESQPDEETEPDTPDHFPGAIPEPSPADGGPGGR